MKKRGQFFLIAALIIALILASFIGLVNYAKSEKESSMGELQKDLENEITYTLDYGSSNNLSSEQFKTIFKNLSSIYINKSKDKTSIFLYGEAPGKIVANGKNSKDSEIKINIDGTWSVLKNGIGEFEEDYTLSQNKSYLMIANDLYEFDFNKGENFKYFISKDKGKENFIISG